MSLTPSQILRPSRPKQPASKLNAFGCSLSFDGRQKIRFLPPQIIHTHTHTQSTLYCLQTRPGFLFIVALDTVQDENQSVLTLAGLIHVGREPWSGACLGRFILACKTVSTMLHSLPISILTLGSKVNRIVVSWHSTAWQGTELPIPTGLPTRQSKSVVLAPSGLAMDSSNIDGREVLVKTASGDAGLAWCGSGGVKTY